MEAADASFVEMFANMNMEMGGVEYAYVAEFAVMKTRKVEDMENVNIAENAIMKTSKVECLENASIVEHAIMKTRKAEYMENASIVEHAIMNVRVEVLENASIVEFVSMWMMVLLISIIVSFVEKPRQLHLVVQFLSQTQGDEFQVLFYFHAQ